MKSFVLKQLRTFIVYDRKGQHSSKGGKEKLDLKLVSKQSNKLERANTFEVFEQSNKSDSDLEVIEDDCNPEIHDSNDSEEDRSSSEFRSKVNKMKTCHVLEKFHKNHVLRYPFFVEFIQTSMRSYCMS